MSGAEKGGDAEGEQHPHHGGHVQVWRINSDLVIILIILILRKVRESRQELRKYMREVKKSNPSVVCSLQ